MCHRGSPPSFLSFTPPPLFSHSFIPPTCRQQPAGPDFRVCCSLLHIPSCPSFPLPAESTSVSPLNNHTRFLQNRCSRYQSQVRAFPAPPLSTLPTLSPSLSNHAQVVFPMTTFRENEPAPRLTDRGLSVKQHEPSAFTPNLQQQPQAGYPQYPPHLPSTMSKTVRRGGVTKGCVETLSGSRSRRRVTTKLSRTR